MTDAPSDGWREMCRLMDVDPDQHEPPESDVQQRATLHLVDIKQMHLSERYLTDRAGDA
jgi:hypothetical protein